MRIHTTVWGLGNPLLRDDAAGLEVVRLLGEKKLPNFSLRRCELAPANYLATLEGERPRRFLLIDASDMGLPPGSLRRFSLTRVDDPSFTSHDLPLPQLLAGTLPPDCEAWVVAIQAHARRGPGGAGVRRMDRRGTARRDRRARINRNRLFNQDETNRPDNIFSQRDRRRSPRTFPSP